MPSEIKNVSFEPEIVLKTKDFCFRYSQFTNVNADFLISARAPSERGHNCWPKYESTCDFLPNHDASKNNAADQSGPSGLITLTHMQCEGGFTYVKLTGDLSCPNCDSNMKVKILPYDSFIMESQINFLISEAWAERSPSHHFSIFSIGSPTSIPPSPTPKKSEN